MPDASVYFFFDTVVVITALCSKQNAQLSEAPVWLVAVVLFLFCSVLVNRKKFFSTADISLLRCFQCSLWHEHQCF